MTDIILEVEKVKSKTESEFFKDVLIGDILKLRLIFSSSRLGDKIEVTNLTNGKTCLKTRRQVLSCLQCFTLGKVKL